MTSSAAGSHANSVAPATPVVTPSPRANVALGAKTHHRPELCFVIHSSQCVIFASNRGPLPILVNQRLKRVFVFHKFL